MRYLGETADQHIARIDHQVQQLEKSLEFTIDALEKLTETVDKLFRALQRERKQYGSEGDG